VPDLFDMDLRAQRRDRAARKGVELFLYERAFDDCLERLALMQRKFERALLIGCPDSGWPERLRGHSRDVEVRDPGRLFADRSHGELLIEDRWLPPEAAYDLVLAIGTLDTVNDLPLALRLIRHSLRPRRLFLGVLSGGETLPQLRMAMRAADAVSAGAAPHVHPRIEAAALAPLLGDAGFVQPVVDVDRIPVSYGSLDRLISDLRAMAATSVLQSRAHFVGKNALSAARRAFADAGDGARTVETYEILHFAAWAANKG
jgi:hypothetical protein